MIQGDLFTRDFQLEVITVEQAWRAERRVSNLVNQAYGLTPEEVALMWATAPPRMPLAS
jgi:hypothetical protein